MPLRDEETAAGKVKDKTHFSESHLQPSANAPGL